jgi:D-alanyl-lipoteichoic acid acyltransferase DltB (MBOAT superfamily)
VNLLITFVASGLWHGANWTFIVWGGLHGVYLIASKLTSRFRSAVAEATGITRFKRLHALIQMSITFVLVTIAWVFFRASSIGSAFYVLKHLIPRGGFSGSVLIAAGIPRANTPFIMLFVVVMFVVEWFMAHLSRTPALWRSRATRFAAYYAVAYSIIFFGVFGHTDFIYFQF